MSGLARTVSTMSIVPLLLCARDEGIGAAAMLAGSDLTEQQLNDPHRLVGFEQELAVVRNYLSLTREALPALRSSCYYHYNCFGVLGTALVSHETMLEACRFLVRYVGLTFTPFHVVLHEDQGRVQAAYLDRCDLGECRDFYLLRDLAFVRNLCCEASPEHWATLVKAMDIAMDEPAAAAAIREFFQWPLRFGSEQTLIHSDRAMLGHPLRLANPAVLQMMRQQCDELLGRRQQNSWRQRVESLVMASLAEADPVAVAGQLCCSERSLRRHLGQEGCNFNEIVTTLLQQRALHYLRHSRLPIERIAVLLGYSETAAFAHAFKRWTGTTPSRFRADALADQPALARAEGLAAGQ